jgi:hypothetical protein
MATYVCGSLSGETLKMFFYNHSYIYLSTTKLRYKQFVAIYELSWYKNRNEIITLLALMTFSDGQQLFLYYSFCTPRIPLVATPLYSVAHFSDSFVV